MVVLSSAFWTQQLGGDRSIVGQKLLLDGEPYEVLGVMPPSFALRRADVLVPLQFKLDPATRGAHFLVTYARLKPDVTLARATTEMRSLGQTLAREFGTNHGVDVKSYLEATVGILRDRCAVHQADVVDVMAAVRCERGTRVADPLSQRTRAALEREKSLTLRAIKELEFDRAMGKLSEADFHEMSTRLRARAAGLIKQLDSGAGYRDQIERDLAKRLADGAAPAVAPRGMFCTECGTKNETDAKFCKNCGQKL